MSKSSSTGSRHAEFVAGARGAKKELAAKDYDLSAEEDEARLAQKANRPSRKEAERRRNQKEPHRRRERAPTIYGRTRARYAIDIETAILEALENRKTQIARRGFIAIVEDIRGSRFAMQPSSRERSSARRRTDEIAIRDIVDEICDRLCAQFGEKAARTDQPKDWSEIQLRGFLRQRMALLGAGLEALKKDRSAVAQDIRDQDHGRMALYERLYHSARLQNQEIFNDFARFLSNDILVVPRACGDAAYRHGWKEGLAECIRVATGC